MTTVGSTCFHVNKEAGPERGGACPRPLCWQQQGLQHRACVPGTGSMCHRDTVPLQVWLQGPRCSGPGRRGLGGRRKMERARRGRDQKEESESEGAGDGQLASLYSGVGITSPWRLPVPSHTPPRGRGPSTSSALCPGSGKLPQLPVVSSLDPALISVAVWRKPLIWVTLQRGGAEMGFFRI